METTGKIHIEEDGTLIHLPAAEVGDSHQPERLSVEDNPEEATRSAAAKTGGLALGDAMGEIGLSPGMTPLQAKRWEQRRRPIM